ncbi:MAG: Hsp70 family protein [Gammaproteobacteria bacterium]|nr:Hsp70 family protein [Gammaproteobacteria bacterium]MBT6558656.1 Hsp70 family protein [Gammaproteobacteria bacterium]
MSRVGVGVDFGTSNSAAAIFDGETVRLVQLETHDSIVPSATYIDRTLTAKTGQLAVEQYIADNTGRTVELIPEVVGETSQFVDEGGGEEISEVQTSTQKIYGAPVTDSSLQGRLFRGTKRLLGDEEVRRLMVFDHPFRLVALITPLLLRIRKSIEADIGGFANAHLGHPVNFEGRDKFSNQLAMSRLGEAFGYAGVTQRSFYPEPIAASVSFLHANPDAQGETVLSLDFGGGTLDFCLLRRQGQDFNVIATHGIGLGGDHLDQILFRQLLFPHLGKGEMWKRRGYDRDIETRFPFEDFEDLLVNWAVTYTLNQNKFTTPVMERIEAGGPNTIKFERLRDIIKHNLSYLLFTRIRTLKADLSRFEVARLDVPEIDLEIELSRREFEDMISEPLQRVAEALDVTVAKAGLRNDQVDIVLRTGGSSLIPAVRNLLEDRFPGRVVEHDPFTSVAAGLAIANYRGLSFTP